MKKNSREKLEFIEMQIFKTNHMLDFGLDKNALQKNKKIAIEIENLSDKLHDTEELSQSNLITEELFEKISPNLPARTFGKKITQIYNSDEHGYSLQTLYRRCRAWTSNSEIWDEITPFILIISDSNDCVFGAFNTSLPRIKEKLFIGTGESFLFKVKPEVSIFPWSHENSYFMNCGSDYLSIGGTNTGQLRPGRGSFGMGLWIDNDLKRGRSMKCETYNSDILSPEEDFIITSVELWSFVS
ncbi:TLD domain-containing protein 2-like [Styela clava]